MRQARVTFVIGGAAGVLRAIPRDTFVLHNGVVPAVLFETFPRYIYRFPKAFGFRHDAWWGKAALR
ncbi:hypothetical protein MKK88_15905 [Methylobacterium sp. E-005]|uniref:hypothetical protein n=1 Tax=Methylobacterium sp. E-005 TaxID=2836549 RepID=UPI001FBBBFE3|nr:hypothetical protein [Methylobacterium sp. E-005]MCJ2087455.1 hypothetical protein [Methylobacterium sp. E-005]